MEDKENKETTVNDREDENDYSDIQSCSMTEDLNISVLTCDSEDKSSLIHKKTGELPEPPSGWFFSLIIVWAFHSSPFYPTFPLIPSIPCM